MSGAGKGSPPIEHRFRKGQSGNPKGRPKGSRNKPKRRPHTFDKMVSFMVGGKQKQITRSEQLLLLARKMATEDRDAGLRRLLLKQDEEMRVLFAREKPKKPTVVILIEREDPPGIYNIEDAMRALDAAFVFYKYKKTARVLLKPWIVQAAVDGLEERRLSREEQEMVLAKTYSPYLVNWPEWWAPDLRGKKRKSPRKRE